MPAYRRGRRTAPWREVFAACTQPVDGGHVRWTGRVSETGTPVISVQGRAVTVYRLQFGDVHGREPDGSVRPGCGYPRCVAGDHLEDRRLREERGPVEASDVSR